MFYRYEQHPAGGVYADPAQNIVVEADDWQEANAIAEKLGAYFDGMNCYGYCLDELGYNDGVICSCQLDFGQARWVEIFEDCVATTEAPVLVGEFQDGVPYAVVMRKQAAVRQLHALRVPA